MFKTCTFTLMHIIIAFSVAGLLSGSWIVGGAIALVEPLCNSVGYFFHEKYWDKYRSSTVQDSQHHLVLAQTQKRK